jgi:hypothetical protein
MTTSLSNSLRYGISNSIRRTSDYDHLVIHTELLKDIGRGVGERAGESLADNAAIIKVHGHVCDSFVLFFKIVNLSQFFGSSRLLFNS